MPGTAVPGDLVLPNKPPPPPHLVPDERSHRRLSFLQTARPQRRTIHLQTRRRRRTAGAAHRPRSRPRWARSNPGAAAPIEPSAAFPRSRGRRCLSMRERPPPDVPLPDRPPSAPPALTDAATPPRSAAATTPLHRPPSALSGRVLPPPPETAAAAARGATAGESF
jgi:hypothetical protein